MPDRQLPRARISLNPIQWMATDDGWLDPARAPEKPELLSLVKGAGFDSVMTDVPAGWTVPQYRELLDDLGLVPAPGYLVCRSDGGDGHEQAVLDLAAQTARVHAGLGLTDIGLGLSMGVSPSRLRRPAQGQDGSPQRLAALTDLVDRIADVMIAEGVRPALHPHVGTWIETESEARAVLDAVASGRLGFLPDTGHLAWAGADVASMIRDYAGRIPLVHLKDCRLGVAAESRAADRDYRATVRAGLWVEPGRGELPLTEFLDCLGSEFDGWLMVEVDSPDLPDPYQSAVASATWARGVFGGTID
ncbi:sugar phosphate isomerase/epimerase family protein [Micromonospora sp. NPDC049903]|uniref:sugar phosphate isomerase/epimerase family protein n=1 Tax=Micromonospora sp. NPDC049903 TaxID=3364276 RepID=UPI0037B88F3B